MTTVLLIHIMAAVGAALAASLICTAIGRQLGIT